MGQPVVHFEIMGTDGEVLRAFYSDLFSWKIDSSNPMGYGLVSPAGNGSGIGGGVAEGPAGYAGHVTFYVEVADVEDALTTAEQLGGTRIMGPESVMGVDMGLFNDPEGHLVGVVTARP